MLYTYEFTDLSSRNNFVNIVKELWFMVNFNTYTEINSSKSEVKDHLLWNGRDVKTTNNTITRYEINIEKDMNEEEIQKFKNFDYYYFHKKRPKPDAWLSEWILWWFWVTLLIRWILALILKYIKIPYLINFYNVDELKYMLLLWIFLFLSINFCISWKPIAIKKANELEEKNKKIKEMLIKEYLWEYGKKIITNM